MSKQPIHSSEAPQAIGPYSQAMRAGDTVYVSGQIPLDPGSMELVEGDIEAQARQVFANLRAILRAAGGDMDDIVKLNIYMTDLSHFARVNDLMKETFNEPYPARATLGIQSLPKGARIEMDAVARLG